MTAPRSGTRSCSLPPAALVAELNDRARTHRLAADPGAPTAAVPLADGARASVGDTVITRTNDRALRMTATDWVKNGDRWHVTALGDDGSMTVQHVRNRHHVRLPRAYVAASVDLGYASTIHTAQGVTADASHTLLTGGESRQLAYTAVTRGRAANHLYLEVVGDGDEHNLVQPREHPPLTATDLLQRILTRDDSSRSASTTRRDVDDPGHPADPGGRPLPDSLHVAAEDRLGPQTDRPPRQRRRPDRARHHPRRRLAHPARPPRPASPRTAWTRSSSCT